MPADYLALVVKLLIYYVKVLLLGGNPRSLQKAKFSMPSTNWGVVSGQKPVGNPIDPKLYSIGLSDNAPHCYNRFVILDYRTFSLVSGLSIYAR